MRYRRRFQTQNDLKIRVINLRVKQFSAWSNAFRTAERSWDLCYFVLPCAVKNKIITGLSNAFEDAERSLNLRYFVLLCAVGMNIIGARSNGVVSAERFRDPRYFILPWAVEKNNAWSNTFGTSAQSRDSYYFVLLRAFKRTTLYTRHTIYQNEHSYTPYPIYPIYQWFLVEV